MQTVWEFHDDHITVLGWPYETPYNYPPALAAQLAEDYVHTFEASTAPARGEA